MSNGKALPHFDIFTTKDQSPTMSLNWGEKMHSLEGALSESLYIYGSCLEKGLSFKPPKVLSMGLGLGYNEIIALALFLKHSINDYQIHSFEKVSFLSDGFRAWAQESKHPFSEIHNKILQIISSHFELNPEDLFKAVQQSITNKQLTLHSDLPEINNTDWRFNVVLYDAFSSGTDDDLWTPDHLDGFLSNYCDDECFFTTYAATGNLKRALKKQNFTVEKKKGFGVKRESTFAYRSKGNNYQ